LSWSRFVRDGHILGHSMGARGTGGEGTPDRFCPIEREQPVTQKVKSDLWNVTTKYRYSANTERVKMEVMNDCKEWCVSKE